MAISRVLARHPLLFQSLNRVGRPLLIEPILSAAARSASRRAISRNGGKRFVELDAGGFTMSLDLAAPRDALLLSQLKKGRYEPATSAFLADRLQPGDVFVNGGANDGYFTLMASRLVGRSGQVIAFEPSSSPRAKLCRNIRRNMIVNVEVRSEALWSQKAELPLYQSRREDGFDSLLRLPHYHQRAPSLVEATTLDSAVPGGFKIGKLDLEGSEGEALGGASQLLRSHKIRYLVVEWAPSLARSLAGLERRFMAYLGAGRVYELLPSAGSPGYLLKGLVSSYRELPAMPTNLVIVP